MSVLKTKFAAKAAKTLRSNSTDAERRLWSVLRNRQLQGFKFVRQQPVAQFIADFACREANLIIELNGGQHAECEYDIGRTSILLKHGYEVLRFWNDEVLTNLDGTMEVMAEHLNKVLSPGLRYAKTDLSPKGRDEEEPSPQTPIFPSRGEVGARRQRGDSP